MTENRNIPVVTFTRDIIIESKDLRLGEIVGQGKLIDGQDTMRGCFH